MCCELIAKLISNNIGWKTLGGRARKMLATKIRPGHFAQSTYCGERGLLPNGFCGHKQVMVSQKCNEMLHENLLVLLISL